jgi:hypothetical protein
MRDLVIGGLEIGDCPLQMFAMKMGACDTASQCSKTTAVDGSDSLRARYRRQDAAEGLES